MKPGGGVVWREHGTRTRRASGDAVACAQALADATSREVTLGAQACGIWNELC